MVLLADASQALDRVGGRVAGIDLDAHDADDRDGIELHHLERDELRFASPTLIDATLDDHDAILLEQRSRSREGLREDDHLNHARRVFELDEGHRIALLRHRLTHGRYKAADRDGLPLLAIFELADRYIDLTS